MNRLRVHPVQYLLIGFAMIVFYTLLLSISEHTRFGLAYTISAAGVTVLITGYAKSILKSTKVAWMVGSLLITLYSYLYILLQLEDYALLMGSVGLFTVLAAIMYLTRKINWYDISERKTVAAESNIV
jgi:inner membrane protein